MRLGLKKNKEFYCIARRHTNINFSKNLLLNFYQKQKLSTRKIAGKLGVGKTTIEYYLNKYGIKRRSHAEANKERFKKEKIWCKGLTKTTDIRIKKKTEKMKETWNLKRKEKLEKIVKKFETSLPKLLYRLYWNKKLNQKQIAKKLKINRKLVIELMKEFKINKRVKYQKIANLKGKNHPMYGKTWEDVYGNQANIMRKLASDRFRKLTIKRITDNKFPFSKTSIEELLAKEMDRKKLLFVDQFNLDNKFIFDFAIPQFKLLIECDGDYWHANPKFYERRNMKKLHKRQKMNIVRDKIKNKYANNKGWYVLRFFESEIKKSPSKCVDRIIEFIQTF